MNYHKASIYANNKTLKVGDKVAYCGDVYEELRGATGTLMSRIETLDGWTVEYDGHRLWNLPTEHLILRSYETPSKMANSDLYCKCSPSERELITNNAGGDSFRYCKTCKKEFKMNRSW